METFYKKNDIGVKIEYGIISRYEEDGIKYMVYTDFSEDKNSPSGIKLYVAKYEEVKEDVSEEKKNEIINKMYNTILSYAPQGGDIR